MTAFNYIIDSLTAISFISNTYLSSSAYGVFGFVLSCSCIFAIFCSRVIFFSAS